MDYKTTSAAANTETRDLRRLDKETGNIFESIAILSTRANQISVDLKEEINSRMEEFQPAVDSLDEIYENREQIEMSRMYERMPKPPNLAVQEMLEDRIYYRNPAKEAQA
jgi:DNA-directed RNA polymerase subunit K/omega